MRPYHILLAARIIILYQLILLFCVHRGLLFFLVLLFAISETSPTYSTRVVLFTFLLSTSLVTPYFSCLAGGASSSGLVLSYISTLPFPFRLFAPQLVQTPPLQSRRLFDIVSLRVLGFT